MATELTWVTDANRQVASAPDTATQNKWELWYLLASLCGNSNLGLASNAGNWSVVRTCGSTDGTSGTLTADATDRLHLGSGSFTANDWVFGANTTSGTARTWAMIQSPSGIGSYYLIVDFGNATGGKCDIIVGKTISTNGTTTARPTLTDEWVYSAAQFNNNSIANTHRCSLSLSSRGDFWFFEAFDTNGTAYSILGVTKLQGGHSGDNYQTISMFGGGGLVNTTSYTVSGGASSIAGTTNAVGKGRNFSGAATGTMMAIAPSLYSSSSPAAVITSGSVTGTNQSDTTYNAFPIWIIDITNNELKGRMPDVLWASGGLSQGANIPNSTPYDCVKFGQVFFPWVSTSAPQI